MLSVAILADTNPSIGTGHVTRCVALAQSLCRLGALVSITGELQGPTWLQELASPYFAGQSATGVGKHDILICDSYSENRNCEFAMYPTDALKVLIADDATPLVQVDVYVEPGVNARSSTLQESKDTVTLKGPRHLLIRDEIRRVERGKRHYELVDSPSLLVSFGGGSGYGLLEPTLNFLQSISDQCSVSYLAPSEIEDFSFARWLPPSGNLAQVFSSADIAVTAAGVTSWELLHHGVAVGLLAAVDNQEANYSFMTSEGLAVGLGRLYAGEPLDFSPLEALINDAGLRRSLGQSAWDAVDGTGADRVAEQLIALVEQRSLEE